jgi:KDO2-lipid IV(A) lauroyltransferase
MAVSGAGPEAVRAAAADPRALERLVRAAFRHAARYYLEVARTPALTERTIRERLLVETPDVVEAAFADDRPVIFVGLHFGAIELPALYLSLRTGRAAVTPMETIGDPALQRYFVRTRGAVGVRIVGLREARRELLAALRRGESVGLVGDRDLTGGGVDVPLFGAPARLPAGPALLAIEAGAPLYVAAVRRAGPGRYRGQLRSVEVAAEGSRRERLTATLDGLARAFEAAIAEAPEQWWAVFFPIWPDLEAETPR